MEKTLAILNDLEESGLIMRYALGGAMAFLFYAEPILTYDMDAFVFLPPSAGAVLSLSPIYQYLRKRGYKEHKEHVVVEGVPLQLIPAYNKLIEEAVQKAVEVHYRDVKTRVIRPEHLVAIALQTGRAKDKERLGQFLAVAKINRKSLDDILKRHGLWKKWKETRKHDAK